MWVNLFVKNTRRTIYFSSLQAEVALAKLKRAKAYGAAGSDAKRQAFRDMVYVHAFDSHSERWFQDLMKSNQGQGVDKVLRSLAGEHFDPCLEALAPGGWHREIGKVDIFAHRPVKLAVFRKNIKYRAIDIGRLMTDDPYLVGDLMHEVLSLIEAKKVPNLPFAKYCYSEFIAIIAVNLSSHCMPQRTDLASFDCRSVFG